MDVALKKSRRKSLTVRLMQLQRIVEFILFRNTPSIVGVARALMDRSVPGAFGCRGRKQWGERQVKVVPAPAIGLPSLANR